MHPCVHCSVIYNRQHLEQPKCPSVDGWIKHLWYIYTMEFYSAVKKKKILVFAALFTIAQIWKQPKCPSVDEWVKQLWDIYTMDYYLAIKKKKILPLQQ